MMVASKILNDYLNDMLAVEREIHQAFSRQQRDEQVKRFPAVAVLIGSVEESIDRHIETVSETLTHLGTSESPLQRVVGTVLGIVTGIYGKVRPDGKVSSLLRDDYAALSFAVVCYQMLHTTALALGEERVTELAIGNLEDYASAIMRISEIIPPLVVQELASEGKIPADAGVAEEAVRHVRDAWAHAS
jgi:ferritin-like metal-binding protein YciE